MPQRGPAGRVRNRLLQIRALRLDISAKYVSQSSDVNGSPLSLRAFLRIRRRAKRCQSVR